MGLIKQFIANRKACKHRRTGEGTGWYYGNFVAPVYGRYERHCLDCGRKELWERRTKTLDSF
jgi:hypothetical protein